MLFRDMQRLGEKEEGGCGAKLSVPFIFLSYFFFLIILWSYQKIFKFLFFKMEVN